MSNTTVTPEAMAIIERICKELGSGELNIAVAKCWFQFFVKYPELLRAQGLLDVSKVKGIMELILTETSAEDHYYAKNRIWHLCTDFLSTLTQSTQQEDK